MENKSKARQISQILVLPCFASLYQNGKHFLYNGVFGDISGGSRHVVRPVGVNIRTPQEHHMWRSKDCVLEQVQLI